MSKKGLVHWIGSAIARGKEFISEPTREAGEHGGEDGANDRMSNLRMKFDQYDKEGKGVLAREDCMLLLRDLFLTFSDELPTQERVDLAVRSLSNSIGMSEEEEGWEVGFQDLYLQGPNSSKELQAGQGGTSQLEGSSSPAAVLPRINSSGIEPPAKNSPMALRNSQQVVTGEERQKTSSSPPPERINGRRSKGWEGGEDLTPAIRDIRDTLIDCNTFIKRWELSIDEHIERQLEILKLREVEVKGPQANDPA
ncbi:hypothetical protein GUITHDRAFT_121470 [Guillardia theta CCMP2712]|uniref:EF-hand domain-containing protein n=1 Tax=Guillardia theta (strain CCMP2712) TaxID=905079 RepID=L1I944_GUITC|nr:hypothetical protein GUITHDRAFT_121470 [Guillardia theta CCMP2712]EKX32360.1 hypothetical protein GUITHDRAFT_121470 [Guillardia theta CCMP2712]|eukprot:XP_005819340.1 hypothetical protein GUITHDRAFT_121470 [Guillardia theta CCMP2712]